MATSRVDPTSKDPNARDRRDREIVALERELEDRRAKLEELKRAAAKALRVERRAELHRRRYWTGELCRMAGLLEEDSALLLGALLSLAGRRGPDGTWPGDLLDSYRRLGEPVLSAYREDRKRLKRAIALGKVTDVEEALDFHIEDNQR